MPRYGPPNARWLPERLPLGDRDVGSELARRREHPERGRVEDLDQPGARGMRGVGPGGGHPRGRRRRWDAARRPRPRPARPLRDAAAARGRLESFDRGAAARRRTCAGCRRSRGSTPPATRTRLRSRREAHVRRLDERGGAVVQRRVRDLQRRQLADHRLELEQRLQDALGQLRLVGRVGGVELRAARQAPRRPTGCSGRTRRRPRSTRGRRPSGCGRRGRARRPRSPAPRRRAGRSSGCASRTAAGICSKRSSTDGAPIVVEHLAHVVLGVRREIHDGQSTAGSQPDAAGQPDASSRPYLVTRDR